MTPASPAPRRKSSGADTSPSPREAGIAPRAKEGGVALQKVTTLQEHINLLQEELAAQVRPQRHRVQARGDKTKVTKVTWTMSGPAPFISKLISVLVSRARRDDTSACQCRCG